jgi:hypothetical protein
MNSTKTEGENQKGEQYNTIILMSIKASSLTVQFTWINIMIVLISAHRQLKAQHEPH